MFYIIHYDLTTGIVDAVLQSEKGQYLKNYNNIDWFIEDLTDIEVNQISHGIKKVDIATIESKLDPQRFLADLTGIISNPIQAGYEEDVLTGKLIETITSERDQIVAGLISIADYKNKSIDLIIEKFNIAYRLFLQSSGRYGEEEQKTWDLQSLRATEWLNIVVQPDLSISYANVTPSLRSSCACIAQMAIERLGSSIDDNITTIAQYINSKRIAFETEAGRLLGIMGAKRDEINATPITDIGVAYDQIKAIVDSTTF